MVVSVALGSEPLQRPFGGQTRRGQRRAKRWVLLRMGLGLLTQGLGHLRMGVFPAGAATAGRLGAQAPAPRAPLGQAQLDRVTSPPNTLSAWRAFPPQYFSVISAAKARRVAPVIFAAAKRTSAICSGPGG